MDCAITPDNLFSEWCNHQDEPWALAVHLGITPAQLADLADNPVFARRVATWQALTRAYREAIVFDHQNAAAATLRATMAAGDPIEARRAATVLTRLSRNMQMLIAGGTGRGGSARGGTALQ
ncbi:MAG: hypothetical protein AABZ53_16010, partial [Planctomycetota bacterium]